MKKSRFTDSQILEALKRAEAGLAVPELCRELGISSATFYKWRSKYGGMDASMMSRMFLNAATTVRMAGARHVHAVVLQTFTSSAALPSLRLSARARQFSSFVLMV